jgi:hypothetical protein
MLKHLFSFIYGISQLLAANALWLGVSWGFD